MRTSAHGKIVKEYVHQYSDDLMSGKINKKQLARKILKDHPAFDVDDRSLEKIRQMVRAYTGSSKGDNRQSGIDFKSTIEHGLKSTVVSDFKPIEPFIFPDYKKIGLISDVHIPYQDNDACMVAIDFMKKIKIDSLIINGDMLDFYSISKFSNDPTMRSIDSELDLGRAFVDYIKQELNVPIFYKIGNHEERLTHYLWRRSPELSSLRELKLETLLQNRIGDVTMVSSRQRIKVGKLTVIHGHEFGSGFSAFNPVNPARGLFLKAKANILAGHWHQASEHPENNINGDPMGAYSTGCLCGLEPEYAPFAFTKWTHGLAVIHVQDDYFSVDNRRIIKGRVL